MGFTAISAVMALAGTVVSAVGSQQQSQAQDRQREYQESMLRRNAVIAEQQAEAVEEEGREARRDAHDEAVRKRQEAVRMVAGARADMAASGAQVDQGSGLDMAQDVAERGVLDALRVREQGERAYHGQQLRAWNLRNQAQGLQAQADMTGNASRDYGALDLLGRGLQTGSRYLKANARKQLGPL